MSSWPPYASIHFWHSRGLQALPLTTCAQLSTDAFQFSPSVEASILCDERSLDAAGRQAVLGCVKETLVSLPCGIRCCLPRSLSLKGSVPQTDGTTFVFAIEILSPNWKRGCSKLARKVPHVCSAPRITACSPVSLTPSSLQSPIIVLVVGSRPAPCLLDQF